MKKIISVLLSLVMLLSVAQFSTVTTKAADELFTVSNITTSTAMVNFQKVNQFYADLGYEVVGAKISIWTAGMAEDKVIWDNASQYVDYVNLFGLPAGSTIFVTVEPYVVLNGEMSTGYKFTTFDTLKGSGSSSLTGSNGSTGKSPASSIKKAVMAGDEAGLQFKAVAADGYEYRICNMKGKKVKSGSTSLTYAKYLIVPRKSVLYAQVRTYKYVSGNKVYSDWSAKKYFAPQPKVNASKSGVSSSGKTVKLTWAKVKGAKKYTIYGRVKGSKKWSKVASTKKASYTIKKLKGSAINVFKKDYEFTIVSNCKVGKKNLNSDKLDIHYTYTYYR